MQNTYGFGKTVDLGFDAAVERVTAELAKEGFGILTEIDVKATHEEEARRRRAAVPHPRRLQPALREARARSGTDGRASYTVQRHGARGRGGSDHINFMDPGVMSQMTANPDLAKVAGEVREKLQRVMNAL